MSSSKVFYGVTPSVFACVKTTSQQQHGTVYDPPDGNQGTAITQTSTWTVKLAFNFDPGSDQITYTILYKTWIITDSEIWSGIGDTINGCIGSVAAKARRSERYP